MAEPLTPREADELLQPNPPSWGLDGYPAGFSLFGFPVICNPDLRTDEIRFVSADDAPTDGGGANAD